MTELPYSIIKKLHRHMLYSDSTKELRNNPYFNIDIFMKRIKEIIYDRYRELNYPLIRPDDINSIASSVVESRYIEHLNLTLNSTCKSDVAYVDISGQVMYK